MSAQIKVLECGGLITHLRVRPNLFEKIKSLAKDNLGIVHIIDEATNGAKPNFVRSNGVFRFRTRLCVPQVGNLKIEVLEEAHSSKFVIHHGETKMYRDLRHICWWPGLKPDITKFVAQWLVCQQVKVEHQRSSRKLQPLLISKWKWEHITMDFGFGFPKSMVGSNAVWVIVDRLTKSAYFLPIGTTWSLNKLVLLFVKEIVRMHGVSITTV